MRLSPACLVFPAILLVVGCQDGLDIPGDSIEGYETLGSRGGTLTTPDGNFDLEIDRGALRTNLEVTVGALDDCLPTEIACFEMQPEGLILDRPAIATVDIEGVGDPNRITAAARPLEVLVNEGSGWRVAKVVDSHQVTVSVQIGVLGLVAVVPGQPK